MDSTFKSDINVDFFKSVQRILVLQFWQLWEKLGSSCDELTCCGIGVLELYQLQK
jgi:hypothetical protein